MTFCHLIFKYIYYTILFLEVYGIDQGTEEQKEKIRNVIKGRKVDRYEIIQYDIEMNLVKIWKSLRDIERNDNSLSRSQISKCCKGLKNSYAGYIWKYRINI